MPPTGLISISLWQREFTFLFQDETPVAEHSAGFSRGSRQERWESIRVGVSEES